jgi:hypothetical protein
VGYDPDATGLFDKRKEVKQLNKETEMSADDTQVGGSHYKEMDPQPWSVMQSLLTPEEFRGFLKGNMIKYAMRQGKKDSPDAGKYHHYAAKLREVTGGDTWM